MKKKDDKFSGKTKNMEKYFSERAYFRYHAITNFYAHEIAIIFLFRKIISPSMYRIVYE